MAVEVGAQAPDFTAKDQNKSDVALADFRGRKAVLLVFYPFAFSSICTNELRAVRDQLPRFQNDDVQILAVSTDPTFSLKAFATAEGYEFPLLSDFWPHGELARTYGVFNDASGMANRGTFLIDRDGAVRFSECNEPGVPRDQDDWLEAVAALA
ncbi:MAG TPA: peroxiredoxin [Mycobacteriales bacterium]|nr:peroxiredoxin [Mycobacteriales bacterium]